MLQAVAVEGYRSLRRLVLPLAPLTVVTGPNGSGKSNLYRALRLLTQMAGDGAVGSVAREGGLGSVVWAGPEEISRAVRAGEFPTQGTRRSRPIGVKLGFASDEFSYAADLGLPGPTSLSAFTLDPEIKAESVWSGPVLRPGSLLLERKNAIVRVRDDGGWRTADHRLAAWESILSALDAETAPEVRGLRNELGSWRFYDSLRTDQDAPARRPQVGTRTPVLASDGSDVAAAIQTIRELSPTPAFDAVIDSAFPGSLVEIAVEAGRFTLLLRQPGLLRPLGAAELSDGTLRYILLAAALLSPRPAPLLVLNEPETSLHPDLYAPLVGLIVESARRSQTIVVSHSSRLVEALGEAGAQRHELAKHLGETTLVGQTALSEPRWDWPSR